MSEEREAVINGLMDGFCDTCRTRAVELVEAVKTPHKRRKKLPAEDGEKWVTLRSLFGTSKIPESAAEVVSAAVDAMVAREDVGEANKWQALEYLAAEYIAGSDNGETAESD